MELIRSSVVVPQTGSTMELALEMVAAGVELPAAACARIQSGGRGRLGRPWSSPPGGVWLTIAWPMGDVVKGREGKGAVDGGKGGSTWGEAAALVAGLGVRDAVMGSAKRAVAPFDAAGLKLKWPNDLLLEGRKIAGVLCERLEHEGRDVLLVGVGINADFDEAALPEDVRFPATTLRSALGAAVDADGLRDGVLARVAERLWTAQTGGFSEIDRAEYERVMAFRGERVDLETAHSTVRGVVVGVDGAGRLVLETEGQRSAVSVGEVRRVRPTEMVK